MSEINKLSFDNYVQNFLQEHKGKRVVSFEYENQRYWLKQPERLKGIWRLLKPYPKKAFQTEQKILQDLAQKQAPIPELMCLGEDFLVLKDAGQAISYWISCRDITSEKKSMILVEGAKALVELHKKNLVHGRPALRDMIWNDGQVLFIDFESRSSKKDIVWQKVRDTLIFIHSLGRSEHISDEQMRLTIDIYQQLCEPGVWQRTQAFLNKSRWIYYLLFPFKSIARMDLIAIYRLFENMPKIIVR